MSSVAVISDKQVLLTNLSKGNFDAFLYDCDGTLADNMGGHKASYRAAAVIYGFELDDAIIDELAGWPIIDVAEEIRKRYAANFNPADYAQLKNKLYNLELEKQAAVKAKLDANKQDVTFGSQARSYVFQPYTMVNDHRTELKITDVQKVMDGSIDPFIEAYLKRSGAA